jgi:hypothetical protein
MGPLHPRTALPKHLPKLTPHKWAGGPLWDQVTDTMVGLVSTEPSGNNYGRHSLVTPIGPRRVVLNVNFAEANTNTDPLRLECRRQRPHHMCWPLGE